MCVSVFLVITCIHYVSNRVVGTKCYFQICVPKDGGNFSYHGAIICESGPDFWFIEMFICRAWF